MDNRKRSANFSTDEVETLTAEVLKRSKLLFAAMQGPCMKAAKERSWADVASCVSAVSSIGRSKSNVKKKWSALKSATRMKAVEMKKDIAATGGGPSSDSFLSPFEERILSIVPDVCLSGITGDVDTSCAGKIAKQF